MSLGMRDRLAGLQPLFVAVVGCVPLGIGAGLAQTPPLPGAVPYLTTAPVMVPGNSAVQATPVLPPIPELMPSPPVLPAAPSSGELDLLKQRDQELATIRSDQKRASETENKLRQEIEAVGDDRRKLNQQLIETAARMRSVEEEIGQAEERLQ